MRARARVRLREWCRTCVCQLRHVRARVDAHACMFAGAGSCTCGVRACARACELARMPV